MNTFLDYYNKTLLNKSKGLMPYAAEFVLYYTTKRKPRRVCESDRCFFSTRNENETMIMRMPNGGAWWRKPIHTRNVTHFGLFIPSELNTTILTDKYSGITVYLNKEDAEKAIQEQS